MAFRRDSDDGLAEVLAAEQPDEAARGLLQAVDDVVSVHDLHATLLQLLGFDHTKLTFRHAGRDFRLTDVYGDVVKELIA